MGTEHLIPADSVVADNVQYGCKISSGEWVVDARGWIISGTKAEMCALRDNHAIYGDAWTVEPLPAE